MNSMAEKLNKFPMWYGAAIIYILFALGFVGSIIIYLHERIIISKAPVIANVSLTFSFYTNTLTEEAIS